MLVLTLIASAVLLVVVQSTDYLLYVDLNRVTATKPEPFYGFTIDWWLSNDPTYGKKWGNASALTVDFTNANFIALTAAISPAFLRIGGSPEDSIIYNVSDACTNVNASLPGYSCSQTKNNYGCMTVTRWQQINDFAIKTNSTLLFGLNACYGRLAKNKPMNFSNIIGLFEATLNNIDSHANLYGFELANELQNTIVAATYAADFIVVHEMIQSMFTDKTSPIPYLVAPDVGSSSYSQDVVTAIQEQTNNKDVSGIMHSLTYHHYPNCGYPGNGVVFNLTCLSSIPSAAADHLNVAQTGMTQAWMGEGSEHSGGGITNVSNTFVDCFYYLYQLCNVLTYGVTGTMRSDLIGGDYELIDHNTFLPNPTYWILYLFKMFVGETLYDTIVYGEGNLRAWAFNGVGSGGKNQVVLALINFDLKNNAEVILNILDGASEYTADEYHLKSSETQLNSRIMMVNNVKMEYVSGQFPPVEPVKGDGEIVTVDAATLVFVVLTPQ